MSRTVRLQTNIDSAERQAACNAAEAIMLRKIAGDLLAKASKLDDTAVSLERMIAGWRGMLEQESAQ